MFWLVEFLACLPGSSLLRSPCLAKDTRPLFAVGGGDGETSGGDEEERGAAAVDLVVSGRGGEALQNNQRLATAGGISCRKARARCTCCGRCANTCTGASWCSSSARRHRRWLPENCSRSKARGLPAPARRLGQSDLQSRPGAARPLSCACSECAPRGRRRVLHSADSHSPLPTHTIACVIIWCSRV